jgi:hypothetical protein
MSNLNYYFTYYVKLFELFFYYFTLFQGVTAQFTGAGRHTNLSYAQRRGGHARDVMRRASSAAG